MNKYRCYLSIAIIVFASNHVSRVYADDEKPKEEFNPDCVCHLFKYADYGDYCSYYAKNCVTTQYVSLDDDCSITPSPPYSCPSSSPPCEPCHDTGAAFGTLSRSPQALFIKNTTRAMASWVPRQQRLASNPKPEDFRPTVDNVDGDNNPNNDARILDCLYVKFFVSDSDIRYAKLFLIKIPARTVTYSDKSTENVPARVFGTGVEINRISNPQYTLKGAEVESYDSSKQPYMYRLHAGELTYLVTTY